MNNDCALLDEPIKSVTQDALGRGDFANSVADLILTAPQGSCSQVIGLYGKWGEGKTSLKNMAIEAYKSQCNLPPLIVEFSPWTYTSRERLPFLFFTEIAHVFGNETTDEKAQRLADQFKQFGQILEIVSLVPQLTLFALWVKPILNFFGAKYADQTKSLESVRKQIHSMMADESRRLIVVIDDLDRISAEEVRRMIQLVKANGDFPNITYLLLCDREYVGRALCTVVEGYTVEHGREYLEKIVSFGLDLPRIRTSDLRTFLYYLLEDVLKRHQIKSEQFDPSQELSPNVFQLVHDLRDAKRLIAGFEFQLSMQRKKGRGTASIHLDDLISLEACRLFEPDFYHAVYRQKRVLLCEDESTYTANKSKLDATWIDSNLTHFISDQHKHIAKDFITRHLGWHCIDYLAEKSYSRCNLKDCKITFRLAHPDCFERYFNLYSDPTEFSKADLQEFNESLSNQDAVTRALRKLFDNGRLRDFLSTIESSFDEPNPARQEIFVSALTLAAEFAQDTLPDMHITRGDKFGFSLATHLHRCIRFFLERSVSTEERSNLLMRVFRRETSAVVLPTSILSSEHASRDRQAAVPQLILDKDYDELNKLCIERIEERQLQGKLIGHIDERDLRFMWVTIGNPERIKAMLANDFLSYPSVMHALWPFTGYVSSSEGTFYTIHLDQLEQFTDPKKVLALLMTQSQLPQAQAGLRDCLAYCIDAKINGLPYDHDAQMKQVYKRNH
ncbi:MAG: P-loop NTPase fold protein [bacterium]